MNITVITGSAHRNGTSALLADKFIEGAKEAGHDVFRFDAAFKNIHGCIGCDTCNKKGNGCVYTTLLRLQTVERMGDTVWIRYKV